MIISNNALPLFVGRARSPHAKDGGGEAKKSLASILRLELLEDKTAAEIADIWTQHFASKVKRTIPVIGTEIFYRIQS
jgi:hypothetical protein